MKRFSAVFLTLIMLFSLFNPTFVSQQASADHGTYDTVVLRGSEAPLDWASNNNPLVYDETNQVWNSNPIPLTGGKTVEFKYVYNGNWMPGSNLSFTPDRTGNYIFTFYPHDERRVDVHFADSFEGSITLKVKVPEETPDWAVLTLGSSLNAFNYSLTSLEKTSVENEWELEIGGVPGESIEYQYALGSDKYKELRSTNRKATFSKEGTIVEDVITEWAAIPIAENVTHNFNHSPFVPSQTDDVTVTTTVEHYGPINAGAIYFTTDGSSPAGKRGVVSNGTVAEATVASTEQRENGIYVSTLTGVIPKQANQTRVKYKLDVWYTNGEGSQFADTNSFAAEDATEFAYYVDKFQSPQWAKDASIYHIFVDRFRDGNPKNNDSSVDPDLSYDERLKGWMGGDLAGVKEKLGYIKELGINTIWISPVFEGPYSHGYHPTDFKEIDSRFGDKELMKELIKEAHDQGIKVVYDFVPNHSSSKHPFFEDAKAKGEGSPFYNWYTFTDWPNEYKTFYGVQELPQLNNDNQETRNYMINDVAPYWLTELDFDGFRLDYAKGPSYSFWVDFRHTVKKLNPDAFIFGEVWDSREKINSYAGKLDGALDFGMSDALVNVFAKNHSMLELRNTIQDNLSTYPEEYVTISFLDNHDKPRFLYEAGGDVDKLKLAAATQFTLPGAPAIYYGTEVGLSQSKDHNSVDEWKDRYYREMMPWNKEDQDTDLKKFYQDIIQLRNKEKALRTGSFEEIHVTSDVFVYERNYKNDKFLVVVNKGDARELSINELYNQPNLKSVNLRNALDKKDFAKNNKGQLSLSVDDKSFAIYKVTGKLVKVTDDSKKYYEVVLRGSEPLSWEGNNFSLSYNMNEKVWQSDKIALTAGQRVEFKYVMDGNWLDGDNLSYTPETDGEYVFVFNALDERKVEVRKVR
ncbi:alpha-amylase family glycosyl hydrolase [Cytobacillus sp. FJAT-54145]|uniref:Alpha-amylase family glycosyl hydrolase n=1 Tax=Cytobacillus spartinae TaxID=3299023 RepID=A0ABW6K8C8_9BACI